LLARWGKGHEGLRASLEQGLKIAKQVGFQWQRTRMEDPHRVEQLWLAWRQLLYGFSVWGQGRRNPYQHPQVLALFAPPGESL
jgi:hypothetical protein